MAKKKIALSLLSALMSIGYAHATNANQANNTNASVDFLPVHKSTDHLKVQTPDFIKKDKVEKTEKVAQKDNRKNPIIYVDSIDEIKSIVKDGGTIRFDKTSQPNHFTVEREVNFEKGRDKDYPKPAFNQRKIEELDRFEKRRLAEIHQTKHPHWVKAPRTEVKPLPYVDYQNPNSVYQEPIYPKGEVSNAELSKNLEALINALDNKEYGYLSPLQADLEELKYQIETEEQIKSLKEINESLSNEDLRRFEEAKRREFQNILTQFEIRKNKELEKLKTRQNSERLQLEAQLKEAQTAKERISNRVMEKLHFSRH